MNKSEERILVGLFAKSAIRASTFSVHVEDVNLMRAARNLKALGIVRIDADQPLPSVLTVRPVRNITVDPPAPKGEKR